MMIKTFDVLDLPPFEEDLLFAFKRYREDVFPNLFHCFRAWEYSSCLGSINKRFPDRTSKFTLVDIGGNNSWFSFWVADLYPNSTIWVTDTNDTYESYFYKGDPVIPPNVKYKKSFASQLEEKFGKGSVDIISCISVMEHIEVENEAYRQMLSILKPGSCLMMTVDFDIKNPEKKVHRRYDRSMLLEQLDRVSSLADFPKGFDINSSKEQEERLDANKRNYDRLSPVLRSGLKLWGMPYLSAFLEMVKK